MNRGPRRRYWSSLTGLRLGDGSGPQRTWRGQPFRRRYVASFFVLPQPPHPASAASAQRSRVPVLAVGAVLAVVMFASLLGNGSSPGSAAAPVHPPVGSGTSAPAQSAPSTSATNPSPAATSSTKVLPWQGTIRVSRVGEQVTAGPPRVAGLRFGLAVSGAGALVGSGNLAQWTDAAAPAAATCVAVLTAHAQYQVTVQVGDQICIAALDGRTASAKVTDEGTGDDGTPYVDLDVVAYPT